MLYIYTCVCVCTLADVHVLMVASAEPQMGRVCALMAGQAADVNKFVLKATLESIASRFVYRLRMCRCSPSLPLSPPSHCLLCNNEFKVLPTSNFPVCIFSYSKRRKATERSQLLYFR